MTKRLRVLLLMLACPGLARAQTTTETPLVLRGVPAGQATTEDLPLSLADAVHRGLDHNLAAIVQEEQLHQAMGTRLAALSALLPHASVGVTESAQVISTAAFGFSGFPGIPTIIGPFPLFDARLRVSAPIFDQSAIDDLHSQTALRTAAGADYRQIRETVVLAVANVYFEALADAARVDAAGAQVTTAQALVQNAQDQEAAGVVAEVDVVRQRVQLESARARLITAQNELAKRKLVLARAIGLPAEQNFHFTDHATFTAVPEMTVDGALAEARTKRLDIQSAQARVDAARAERAAASAESLPSAHLNADVGVIGQTTSSALRTYTVAANVSVPVFEGGANRARVEQADAALKQRTAELADLEAGLRYDIETAILDLNAAASGVAVASSGQTLAGQELTQAEDRFRAGVSNTIELAEAQQAVSQASEEYIASVYSHIVAKAELARALGDVETRFLQLVGGQP